MTPYIGIVISFVAFGVGTFFIQKNKWLFLIHTTICCYDFRCHHLKSYWYQLRTI